MADPFTDLLREEPAPSPNYPHDWCWGHCAIEPELPWAYLVCYECWHQFATPEDLLMAHNEIASLYGMQRKTDVTLVWSCPVCSHDF